MAQKRITQLLRSNTVYDTRALAEAALVNEARNDGAIVLARYKSALQSGGYEVISIAGIQAVTGTGQSTTLLATQKDLDALSSELSGGFDDRLKKVEEEITNLQEALKNAAGLTEGTENVTINGQTVPVKTYTYTPPTNSTYLGNTANIKEAIAALDSNLATLAGNAITTITSPNSTITVGGTGNSRTLDANVTNLVDSNDKVLGVTSGKITSNVTLKKITTAASSAYAAQYQLVGKDGTTALGATIDIPRDQVIKDAWLSATENGPEIAASDTTTKAGYIVFEIYTGTTSTDTTKVSVNIGRFLEELEASDIADAIYGDGLVYNTTTKKLDVNVGNGLEIASNKVQVKIDSTSDGALTVSANGVKLAPGVLVKSVKINDLTAATPNASGQVNITLAGKDIKITGFTESTETNAANLVPAATDTVNQALAKLYRTIELDEATTAAALTDLDSRVQDLENATLTAGNGIDTTNNVISVVLDENATGKGTSATTHNQYASNNWNALELSSDGLYLSSIWDCGTY